MKGLKVKDVIIGTGSLIVVGVASKTLYPIIRGQLGYGKQIPDEALADVEDAELDDEE